MAPLVVAGQPHRTCTHHHAHTSHHTTGLLPPTFLPPASPTCHSRRHLPGTACLPAALGQHGRWSPPPNSSAPPPACLPLLRAARACALLRRAARLRTCLPAAAHAPTAASVTRAPRCRLYRKRPCLPLCALSGARAAPRRCCAENGGWRHEEGGRGEDMAGNRQAEEAICALSYRTKHRLLSSVSLPNAHV